MYCDSYNIQIIDHISQIVPILLPFSFGEEFYISRLEIMIKAKHYTDRIETDYLSYLRSLQASLAVGLEKEAP